MWFHFADLVLMRVNNCCHCEVERLYRPQKPRSKEGGAAVVVGSAEALFVFQKEAVRNPESFEAFLCPTLLPVNLSGA
jgi:hypothetical protein